MRTLKKVLALSLVFAMAFTMMAGAAFKDQDKIDSSLNDDIQLLTALGVFQGDENGNFNPTDNVRRSEAAKMIYVLKNNGVDDGAVAFQGVSKYSDVPVGHWAEGYINYCTNLGYMGGWQENGVQKFDPNGNVTGVELMKMLLCMIGYKADVQGYTGNGWQTNVLVDAATSGLSVNFTPSVYGATPRQWTARLMVNALNAYWVAYSKGELTYQDNTYAQQYMKLYSATGTLTETQTNAIANEAVDTVKSDSKYSTIKDVKYSDDKTDASVNFEYAAPNELLGQEVRVYFRGNSTTENVLGTSNKVYGVTATGNEKVVNTTSDAVKFDDNFATNGKVTIEGLGTKAYTGSHDKAIEVRVNYDLRSNDKTMKDLKGTWLGVNSALPVKVIADKDGYVKSIMVTGVPVYGVVNKLDAENGVFELKNASGATFKLTALDNTEITFNKANKDNFDKYLEVASDVKVGDVVQCLGTVDGGAKYTVTKAQSLGAATGYTVKDDGSYKTVKIDGSDYKLSALPMSGYDWTSGSGVGTHKTFYTDGKYVVYSTGDSAAANVSNMAYLIDGGMTVDAFGTTTLKAKVLLADGTQGSYTLNKKDGLGKTVADAGNSFAGKEDKVYTYSISDNVITLKEISTKGALDGNNATYMAATAAIEYKKDTGIAKVDSTEYRTNDSTIFFVKSGESGDYEYAVVKASELKGDVTSANNTATNTTFVAQNVNNFKTILAGVLCMEEMPAAEAKDYYFVTGNANYMGKVDDKYVVELPVNAAGENGVLTFKYDSDSSINSDMVNLNKYVGKIVNAELKSDNSVDVEKGLTVVTIEGGAGKWSKGALNAWDGTNASIGGTFVKINKDVKIFNVDVNDAKDGAKLVEDNSVVYSEESATNVAYLTNSDNEIIAIFCEVDGADISYVTNPVA